MAGPVIRLSLFKALLLQQWYQLSDPGLEEALTDRISFRRFCGFALDEITPDETTFVRFRTVLVEAGMAETLSSPRWPDSLRAKHDPEDRHPHRRHTGRGRGAPAASG